LRTRIRHQGNILTPRKPGNQVLGFGFLVVLMIAGQRCINIVMIQKNLRVTRVLGGDQVDLFKHPQSPQGNVFEITDGGGNE
jgi:hypothetical protein